MLGTYLRIEDDEFLFLLVHHQAGDSECHRDWKMMNAQSLRPFLLEAVHLQFSSLHRYERKLEPVQHHDCCVAECVKQISIVVKERQFTSDVPDVFACEDAKRLAVESSASFNVSFQIFRDFGRELHALLVCERLDAFLGDP